MSKPSYWELLKDPRWQQLRLKVMERESFTCQECGCKTDTLNVHHTYYEKGLSPWEYPPESLKCLCETCHKAAEAIRLVWTKILGKLPHRYQLLALGHANALALKSGSLVNAAVPNDRASWDKELATLVASGLLGCFHSPEVEDLSDAVAALREIATSGRKIDLEAVAECVNQPTPNPTP